MNKETERRRKISISRTGKKHSAATREKISRARTGKARDDNARAAISAGLTGKPKSPAQIENMRAAAKARWAAKRAGKDQ